MSAASTLSWIDRTSRISVQTPDAESTRTRPGPRVRNARGVKADSTEEVVQRLEGMDDDGRKGVSRFVGQNATEEDARAVAERGHAWLLSEDVSGACNAS